MLYTISLTTIVNEKSLNFYEQKISSHDDIEKYVSEYIFGHS